MSYISSTNPGLPVGLMNTGIRLTSSVSSVLQILSCDFGTTGKTQRPFCVRDTLVVGQDNPASVLIPAGVVHAYQNVGEVDGIVINCPNRLYRGTGRKEEVDEIRHENDGDTPFGWMIKLSTDPESVAIADSMTSTMNHVTSSTQK